MKFSHIIKLQLILSVLMVGVILGQLFTEVSLKGFAVVAAVFQILIIISLWKSARSAKNEKQKKNL